MTLRLDHVILRSPDADATVRALSAAGFPVLEAPTIMAGGGMCSAILRAGLVDVEILEVGTPPPDVVGYGLGFVDEADRDLFEVARGLRAAGVPTSVPFQGRANGRTWEVLHLGGLLPDPFPVPRTTRPPSTAGRAGAALIRPFTRAAPLARRATRDAGRSMIVVTRYGFDVQTWRAGADDGPGIVGIEVGGDPEAWAALGALAGPDLRVVANGSPGVRRIVASIDAPLDVGSVRFEPAGSPKER
jgi:hypothetical protein